MSFRPDVTVAAVIERDGRFLLVEERVGRRIMINQPAGHLERGESLLEAVVRETLEETGYTMTPEWLIGIYLWHSAAANRTFLRFALAGPATGPDRSRRLDREVLRTLWMTREQMQAPASVLRSPLVLRCTDDYLAGVRHPLSVLAAPDLAAVAGRIPGGLA